MDRVSRRIGAAIIMTIPSMALIIIFTGLGTFEMINISFGLSLFRLWSLPMFLQELLRSRGCEYFQIRTNRLALLQPRRFFFGIFEVVRLYTGFSFIAITLLFPGSLDCEGTEDKSNPDIVGTGVRVSMYILFLVVFLSLFVGSFHSAPSGTKELGTATLISTCRLAETTKRVLSTTC